MTGRVRPRVRPRDAGAAPGGHAYVNAMTRVGPSMSPPQPPKLLDRMQRGTGVHGGPRPTFSRLELMRPR